MQSSLLPTPRRGALLAALGLALACGEESQLVAPGARDTGAGGTRDAGAPRDAGETPDAGGVDAGALADAGAPDAGPGPCGFDAPVAPDAPRLTLLSHPFSAQVGEPGTSISSRTLRPDGTMAEDGVRLDLGVRVSRLAFVPSGAFALALGERGDLISLRVGAVDDLEVVDRVALPGGDYGELHVLPDGQTALAVGANGNPAAGVSTVHLGCDGRLTVDEAAFFSLRLMDSLAFTPDRSRVWISGGQAVFEPEDANDVRVLEPLAAGGFVERGAFDVFGDLMSADRVALSPDGATLLVPNGLDFSNEADQLAVLSVSGDQIVAMDRLTEGLGGLAEVFFSLDGQTVVASLAEPGHVVALTRSGGAWTETQRIRGVGIADQMAHLRRGPLADHFLVPSTDVDGTSNVALIAVTGPGVLVDLGQHDLGGGLEVIPRAIAVVP